MLRGISIALLAATVSVPLSTAQMRGAMGGGGSGARAGFTGGIGPPHGTSPFSRGVFLGAPFSASDYYPSAPYVVESSPPQIVVVQPGSADHCPRGASPLLIEWRGDRYVRSGGVDQTGECGASALPDYAAPTVTKSSKSGAQKERTDSQVEELAPAALVYRDGHREEISDYDIADGVIYVRGNYWQDGYWAKHIPLSELNLPATMQANQQRGVKFMLPFAPNVVIASF